MPIEFGAAAYRFGHSMVRPSYRANFTSGTGDSTDPTADPFFALVFDANEPNFIRPGHYDRDDLLGGYPAARRYIGWQTFFDLGDGQVKNNKKIDTTISSVLFTLPVPAIAPHTQTAPDRAAAAQPAAPAHLGPAIRPSGRPGDGRADAEPSRPERHRRRLHAVRAPAPRSGTTSSPKPRRHADGLHLGPVGGGIVTETLIGLLRADPTSYLSIYPEFAPFLGTDLALGPNPNPNITGNRAYTRAHFLYYAGVVTPGTYR